MAYTMNHMEEIASLREPRFMSLGLVLERQAEHNPDKVAIIFEGKRITFGEFNRQANRYAHFFYRQGVRKGDVVALLMENRPEYLMAASGVSKLGAIVSLINNGVRKDVLAHAISICDARFLIVGHELLEPYLEVASSVKMKAPGMVLVETEGQNLTLPEGIGNINEELQKMPDTNPDTTGSVSSEDVIVYIYTSGTTGYPKATAVLQKRWLILGHLTSVIAGVGPDAVQYLCIPLYHNSGFDISFSALMVSGSTIVLRRKFSARNFWDDVRQHGCTHFIYVGELCRYIYNQPPRPDDADNPLKVVMGNGIRGDIMIPFKQRFGIERLIEVYGATEGVGSFVNFEEIPGMCGNLNLGNMRQGEIVKYDLEEDEIVRDENGWAVKVQPGETGLLLCEINELNKFAGYVNNPTATEEKILRNVFRPNDMYFNSGDLVKLHEGDYFSFEDRLGDTFRWKSENVSTNQVADVLMQFGGIEDANVYGVKVPNTEGRCGMVALKLLDSSVFRPDEFAAFVMEKLPSYARPYFVRLRQELDITNSFKRVKKHLLQEGFDPEKIGDPLYFLHPEKNTYVPLTKELYQDIVENKVRF